MAQDRSQSSSKANEALWFWEAATASRHGGDRLSAFDDVLVIGKMTEWPLLKRRCAEMLAGPGRAVG